MNKVEQALLDRFIAVHSPNLTASQVDQFFTGISLADVTVDYAILDSKSLDRRGTFTSDARKWTARDQTWVGSLVSEIINPNAVWVGSLTDYLADLSSGKVYVDPNKGIVIFPATVINSYDMASIKTLMTAYALFDFSDVGTIPNLIKTTFIPDTDFPTLSQYPEVTDRLEAMVHFEGGLLVGDLYFVNDGKFQLPAADLGKILTVTV